MDSSTKNVFGQPRLRASLRDLRSPRKNYKSTIEDDLKKLIIMDNLAPEQERETGVRGGCPCHAHTHARMRAVGQAEGGRAGSGQLPALTPASSRPRRPPACWGCVCPCSQESGHRVGQGQDHSVSQPGRPTGASSPLDRMQLPMDAHGGSHILPERRVEAAPACPDHRTRSGGSAQGALGLL